MQLTPAEAVALPVTAAARALLGMRLRSEIGGQPVELVLTEVEAYAAEGDPASHSFRGRTARNASMFGPPGTAYVYRSYGIHWCLNVATGNGAAVLLRGGEPVAGVEVIRRRRGRTDGLTDGPGKLAQALGVTGEHDGTSLLDGVVRLLPGTAAGDDVVVATPRVGITRATDLPWRFVLARPVTG